PSIDLTDARAVMRIDGTITNARLTECIALAMSAVEDELDAWQQQQLDLGRAKLVDVPSKVIAGTSRLVLLYTRAVYATVQADLIERYRDVDTTHAGKQRADTLDPTIDDYRRNVRYAIRDILGRPRADVELL
ncbi:MAG TPA: head completion/stabilization protein, partial [Rhodanobacter sp.]|nr:head completion/stabilization protein [Rhodanobacter sp.]